MSLLPIDAHDRKAYLLGLQIAGDFGIVLAIPVVFLVIIGKWIDQRYNTEPWGMVFGFALAALISGKIIYQKAKYYAKRYEELTEKKTKMNKH